MIEQGVFCYPPCYLSCDHCEFLEHKQTDSRCAAMPELAVFVPAKAVDPALRVHHDGVPPAAGDLHPPRVVQALHPRRCMPPRAAATQSSLSTRWIILSPLACCVVPINLVVDFLLLCFLIGSSMYSFQQRHQMLTTSCSSPFCCLEL